MFVFWGCETKKFDDPLTFQEREWLKKHDGNIAMALETSYAPFAFVDENGIGRGLATEYIELIEKKLNFRIKKSQLNSLNEILDSAQKKEIDIVNAVTETQNRSRYLLFTKPFIEIPNVIIVRKDQKDSLTIDKMKGMKISLVKNYAITEYVTKNYNDLNVVLMPDDLSALMSVSFNQSDATIIDLATASYFIEQNGITNLRIAGESGYNIKLAIASRNDWPILNRIMEKGLLSITDKEKKSIRDKWISFGQIRLSESKEFWIIIATAFLGFLMSIVGIMAWNRLLARQVEQRTIQLKKELAVRNQSEKELKELKIQLSNAMDMAHLAHWEYDVVNDIFIFNDHFYKIFGTTAEQVGGYSMSSAEYAMRFVHPDDMHMVEEETRKAIETDSPNFNRQLEHRILYADGQIGHISVRFFIVKDPQGRTVKTYGVNQDITERKRAENDLRASEDKFRSLVEQAAEMLFLHDIEGNLVDINLAAVENTGYSKQELKKMSVFDIDPDARDRDDMRIYWKSLKIEEPPVIFETKHKRKDGSVYPAEIISSKIVLQERHYILCLARDITERKQAEEKLHRSEETLRAMLNASPLAIVLIDRSGYILDSNEEHATRLGRTHSQILGKCLWDLLPESVRTHRKMQIESVFETAKPFIGEDQREKIWNEYHIHPAIKNKNGEIEAVIVEALDITERKLAEKAFKESKKFLDNLSDIAYRADDKGNLIWVNSSANRIIGFSPEEIIGKPFLPMFIETDHTSLIEVYKRTLMGESLDKTLTFISGITCHVTSLPNRNDKGDIIGTFGVARDITDRLNTEKALQISEDRLKKAQTVAKIGNWEYDVSTGQVWGSKEAFRIYGIERTSEYLPLDEVEKTIVEAKRVNNALVDLITKGVNYDIEFEIIQKDTQRFISAHSIAEIIKDNEGNPLKVLGVIQDITDSKAKEKKTLELIAQLQQAQKMESIGTLAGGIAHDFNNILFPIVGHTEMLLEDFPEDSPFKNSLNEIYKGALRARDLVKQILAFSRQENSELKLMKIQPIIKEALKLIRSTIPTTISITQNLQPDCGAIKADPIQIHQIVMNLTTNAYHAMENDGGELKVILKEVELTKQKLIYTDLTPGRYACLTVSDTGIGISKEVIDKIFDPFFTTKEKGKGTGMGLSVVHGIVKNMKGEIKVYSELGKGSEFHVYLPIAESAFEAKESLIKEPIHGGDERILLVDDEEVIIKMEKQALERLGYKVISFTSSIEALEVFRSNPNKFDVVISDLAMPKMPGDKFADELVKIRPDISILLCTGFSEGMTDEKIESLWIKGLLMKPIVIKDLAKKIREILDGGKCA